MYRPPSCKFKVWFILFSIIGERVRINWRGGGRGGRYYLKRVDSVFWRTTFILFSKVSQTSFLILFFKVLLAFWYPVSIRLRAEVNWVEVSNELNTLLNSSRKRSSFSMSPLSVISTRDTTVLVTETLIIIL